ncbi:unnamed protein product [Peniophora sp. CBMAI 1063]|nr:unnamed protein product [Peniophora sp. CBMAI 1063]
MYATKRADSTDYRKSRIFQHSPIDEEDESVERVHSLHDLGEDDRGLSKVQSDREESDLEGWPEDFAEEDFANGHKKKEGTYREGNQIVDGNAKYLEGDFDMISPSELDIAELNEKDPMQSRQKERVMVPRPENLRHELTGSTHISQADSKKR